MLSQFWATRKKTMKKWLLGSGLAAVCFGLVAWSSVSRAGHFQTHRRAKTIDIEYTKGLAGQPPLENPGFETSSGPGFESTGFEQSDGWCPGFVCGPEFFNCCGSDNPNPATGWHLSQDAQSCLEPHIDTANPFAGSRHLRFTQDPTLVDYDKRVKRTPEHLRTWRAGSS